MWQALVRNAEFGTRNGEAGSFPPSIMVAPWPAVTEDVDTEAEGRMADLIEIVRGVRNVRTEYRVDPGRWVPATIVSADAAFYRRVAIDDLLRPLYPEDDLLAAQHRLRDFLIQRFGGPMTYSQQRGHPRLRMRHAPFAIDQKGRDRWIELMEASLADVNLPAEVVPLLRKFFHDSATFMINRQ